MRALKSAAVTMVVFGLMLSAAGGANAGAVHDAGLFTTELARNDDLSTGSVNIGFGINFFGLNGGNQTTLFVNNNGNVTFNAPLGTFTPFPLINTAVPMIAPFFGDVDTRPAASGITQYGANTLDGRNVFGVNWIGVGYFSNEVNKLNSFQLILTDRSDTGVGNFDFEFNYDQVEWETGEASGGVNGLGGDSARAGWSNGSTDSFEIAGSAIDGALLDSNCDAGGSTGLICHSLNSNIAGQYIFSVRNGEVIGDDDGGTGVPFPGTLVLLGSGLIAMSATAMANRRRAAK